MHAQAEADTEPPGYRETVREALSEYHAKNFPEARALFEQAHQLFPNSRTLRGLGMTAFELRSYRESIGFLEQALTSQVKPLEGSLRAETERLLSRAQRFVGKLNLSLDPPNADVLVDGDRVQYKPGTALVLEIGDHSLTFQASGYLPETRSLKVRGRDSETWSVVLAPVPLPEPVVAAPPPPEIAPVAAERADFFDQRGEQPTPTPVYKNPWLWTGVGVVVVGVIVTATVLATRDKGIAPIESSNHTPNGGVISALGRRP